MFLWPPRSALLRRVFDFLPPPLLDINALQEDLVLRIQNLLILRRCLRLDNAPLRRHLHHDLPEFLAVLLLILELLSARVFCSETPEHRSA